VPHPARRGAAEVDRQRQRAVDSRRQAAPRAGLPFQAGHGARTAQALRLAQPVALARQAAELLPEEPDAALARRQEAPDAALARRQEAPDAALARRQEAPAARDVPGAAVVAERQPEAAPDVAAARPAAGPADAEGPPPEAVAVRDAAVRRQAAA
jgi:hypothetical protein